MIREPAVAGQFYPAGRLELEEEVARLACPDAVKEDALAVVVPHAGYIYSGMVAGQTLSKIKAAGTFVILGPNHTGLGEPFSVMAKGRWRTPLGEAVIDEGLAAKLIAISQLLKDDAQAHAYEHSIEVQLPFLQFLFKEFTFLPVVVAHANGAAYRKIGADIAQAIEESQGPVTIIASSDMTHYEPQKDAKIKDRATIDAILALDADMLLSKIEELGISMCGYGPVAIAIYAARKLGAKRARLVKYQTSGDVTLDYASVVGYAGIIIT